MTPSRADAAPSWVWAPVLPAPGGELDLSADESHYLARVCRVRAGDPTHVTDGAGRVAAVRVLETGARVRVRVDHVDAVAAATSLELWCGAPEGERADWLVEKLAELGVARLVLTDTERASWQRVSSRIERWERLTVAALRQSRQAWRLRIDGPQPLGACAAAGGAGCRVVATEGGGPLGAALTPGRATCAVVGPAEGLAPAEQASLEAAGFLPVALAPARLRAETAALALASAWSAAQVGSG